MGQVSARPDPPPGPGPLPAMDLPARTHRVRALMAGARCEALLISNLVNVRYLTGFSGSAGMLLVRPGDAVLVTDGRYATQAPLQLARSAAVAQVQAVPAAQQLELLGDLTTGLATIGLEAEHVSWAGQRRYARSWGRDKKLVPTDRLVEKLRAQKDEGEIARVAVAAAIADGAFASVLAMLEQGPTEAEVAVALDAEMRLRGAEAPAFDTIVASGPNGAEPHHHPSSRSVGRGELVVVDFGARVDGYCSDMTRTVTAGGDEALSAELRRAVAVVLASQDAGLAAVRDGVAAAEVDRACREVVEAAGWGPLFVHGTGHGVGLDIHEAPSLAKPSPDILCAGQVVTVEPGVYIPGLGGARTEDTVVVTQAGCEVLTLTPKQAQVRERPERRGEGQAVITGHNG
jgi:Xaa-Pro aminopeptidase